MMISAVLDACVLFCAPLRGLLLELATAEMFAPFWSQEIQDEWTRSLLLKRSDLKRETLKEIRRRMDFHFPYGLVRGYEHITPTLKLPDPNDTHVLAVAIYAKAEYIITFNLDDFPDTFLRSFDIKAVAPDEFVLRLIHDEPYHILQAVKKHRLSLTRPPKTVNEYLATLEKQKLPQTVAFLREHESDI
jgi:predicted nucleic acid-binding protein